MPYLLLSLLCALVYLPGITSIPPLDRDESRYAQATRQMLETGDYVSIRFQDQARHKKPVGIYWLQAGSVALFSHAQAAAIGPYRLPSALGAWLAVLLTFHLGRLLFGPRSGFLAALLLGISLGLVLEAHQAKTDAVLLAAVTALHWALARAYLAVHGGASPSTPPWGMALLFWAALGISFLLKGPVGPALAFFTSLTLVAFQRDARWLLGLRPLAGICILAAIVLPWSIAVTVETGGRFFGDAWSQDLLPKLVSGHESHGAWPGYYLGTMLLTFWPGSLLLLPALGWTWRHRRDPQIRFCLAWLVPAWIVFECIPTKLPHYTLPLFPALALLTAHATLALSSSPPIRPGTLWGARWYRRIWLLFSMGVAVALAALPAFLGLAFSWWSLGTALVFLAAALLAMAAFPLPTSVPRRPPSSEFRGGHGLFHADSLRGGVLARFLPGTSMILGAAVFVGMLGEVYLPRLTPLWISQAVVEAVQHQAPASALPLAIAGYHEPSLVFLLGTDTVLTSPEGVARHIAASPGRLGIVADAEQAAFHAALRDLEVQVQTIAHLRGYNYSNGKEIALSFYLSR